MPLPSRRSVGAFLAAAAVAASALATALPAHAMTSDAQSFLSNTNLVRTFWHEAPLAENSTLDAKAEYWAASMALRHWLVESNLVAGLQGLPWVVLGENVGEAPAGVPNAIGVLAHQFVVSAPHFRNMIDPAYTQMGVGVARSPDGTIWVAEEFAQLR